jgi:hypothetical protein
MTVELQQSSVALIFKFSHNMRMFGILYFVFAYCILRMLSFFSLIMSAYEKFKASASFNVKL